MLFLFSLRLKLNFSGVLFYSKVFFVTEAIFCQQIKADDSLKLLFCDLFQCTFKSKFISEIRPNRLPQSLTIELQPTVAK